jgi:hypothetical protein
MSTAMLQTTARSRHRKVTAWRLSFGGVLRSEWVKLRSLRSSSYTCSAPRW